MQQIDEQKLTEESVTYAGKIINSGASEATEEFRTSMIAALAGSYREGFRRGFSSGAVGATRKETPTEETR